jgi:arabinose-5-phosphate isomerase
MHTGDELPLVPLGAGMPEAIGEISRKGFGCVGVIAADGALKGVITDGDIRRHLGGNLLAMTVEEVMTKEPKAVGPETIVATALQTINSSSITSLMVIEDGRTIGLVHLHDLLRIGAA